MGIVNAQHTIADAYEKIDKELLGFIEDVLLNRCENATERMMEFAATIDPKSKPTAVRKLGEVLQQHNFCGGAYSLHASPLLMRTCRWCSQPVACLNRACPGWPT